MKSNFLQSEEWASFQEANGHQSIHLADEGYGFVHELPLIGKYLYMPRWPFGKTNKRMLQGLLETAKKAQCGWVRVEPETKEILQEMQREGEIHIVKAPHDMQPREVFVIDITKSEEDLLRSMKSKTRYNIRLALKKNVKVFITKDTEHQNIFLDLIGKTAERKVITPHPRVYYEKYFTAFPPGMCELFVAEYEGEVLAANLVIFYGSEAIYLHGGTSDEHRDAMAPLLLQWEQMKEAKRRGYHTYDFGGVKSVTHGGDGSWDGITRFKLGFSPATPTRVFPGCYDILIHSQKYWMYDYLRLLKSSFVVMKKFLKR